MVAIDARSLRPSGAPFAALAVACETWDRAQAARAQLAREGLTVPGREGGIRPQRLGDFAMEIFPRERQTPEALAALVKADAERWWAIMKELGIKAE